MTYFITIYGSIKLASYMKNYLEFEKEIKNLEEEVESLKNPYGSEGISEVDTNKIKKPKKKLMKS